MWSQSALALAQQGHDVAAFKPLRGPGAAAMQALRDQGARVIEVGDLPLLPRRAYSALVRFAPPLARLVQSARLQLSLTRFGGPHLVVISQGANIEGVPLARLVHELGLPYVLIAHKAMEERGPAADLRTPMRRAYLDAQAAFFVSEHNRRLTEAQLGARIPHATIVRNPFAVPYEPRNDWPAGEQLRTACVGRLLTSEKGQDLLLNVLARDEWRERSLSVTFFGEGPDRSALATLAAQLGLTNVSFAGHVDDVEAIWREHHALVLPSRCEGLPIVLVEAMLSGRVPIVTNAGGNAEVIADDVTGFVAPSPSEAALAEALERAWQRRHEWRAIGARASQAIRTMIPPDPIGDFAARLTAIAEGATAAAGQSELELSSQT